MSSFRSVVQFTVMIIILVVSACSNRYKGKITVIFDRVDNLEIGSKVYVKGVLIGEVVTLDLALKGVLVDIKLKKDVQIPFDSKFSINPSLLGFASIEIEPSDQKTFLTYKDTVQGYYKEKKVLDHVVSDTTKSRKFKQSLDKIGEGIKELIEVSKDTLK